MAYCIDANAFIQAKNDYYAFDFCPAFWSWLDRHAETDDLICVKAIHDEIANGGDELAAWFRERARHKWLHRIDERQTQEAYRAVAAHVESRRGHYTGEAIANFLRGADPWLIAYALSHGHTVVTHERSRPEARRRVQIPDVCLALNVPSIDPYTLLRNLHARFVLEA